MTKATVPTSKPYLETSPRELAGLDRELMQGLLESSPSRAWKALQSGADPTAYAYCFLSCSMGGGITAVNREELAHDREIGVTYYPSSYVALHGYLDTAARGVKKDVLEQEIAAIIDPAQRPALDISRQLIQQKTGHQSPSSPDMLDVAYALMEAGVEPKPLRMMPNKRILTRLTH